MSCFNFKFQRYILKHVRPTICSISLKCSETCLLGRGFHIPIKNASFSSPTNVGSHNPPPWGPASLLAHRSVSGSNAICNSLSSPLAGIIYFGPLRIAVSFTVLKWVCERCFHIILRNVSFSFSTDVRSHSPWELLKNL